MSTPLSAEELGVKLAVHSFVLKANKHCALLGGTWDQTAFQRLVMMTNVCVLVYHEGKSEP